MCYGRNVTNMFIVCLYLQSILWHYIWHQGSCEKVKSERLEKWKSDVMWSYEYRGLLCYYMYSVKIMYYMFIFHLADVTVTGCQSLLVTVFKGVCFHSENRTNPPTQALCLNHRVCSGMTEHVETVTKKRYGESKRVGNGDYFPNIQEDGLAHRWWSSRAEGWSGPEGSCGRSTVVGAPAQAWARQLRSCVGV